MKEKVVIKEKVEHRILVFREIIMTEGTYRKNLITLQNECLQKLLESGLLTANQEAVVDTILSQIKEIIALSKQLFPDKLKTDDINSFLRNFIAHSKKITLMATYFISQPEYTQFFEKLAKNKETADLLMQINSGKEGFTVSNGLINPIQRPPRYVLLLKELQKRTDESHPDFGLIKKALSNVQQSTFEINEVMRKAEGTGNTVVELQSQIKTIKSLKEKIYFKHLKNCDYTMSLNGEHLDFFTPQGTKILSFYFKEGKLMVKIYKGNKQEMSENIAALSSLSQNGKLFQDKQQVVQGDSTVPYEGLFTEVGKHFKLSQHVRIIKPDKDIHIGGSKPNSVERILKTFVDKNGLTYSIKGGGLFTPKKITIQKNGKNIMTIERLSYGSNSIKVKLLTSDIKLRDGILATIEKDLHVSETHSSFFKVSKEMQDYADSRLTAIKANWKKAKNISDISNCFNDLTALYEKSIEFGKTSLSAKLLNKLNDMQAVLLYLEDFESLSNEMSSFFAEEYSLESHKIIIASLEIFAAKLTKMNRFFPDGIKLEYETMLKELKNKSIEYHNLGMDKHINNVKIAKKGLNKAHQGSLNDIRKAEEKVNSAILRAKKVMAIYPSSEKARELKDAFRHKSYIAIVRELLKQPIAESSRRYLAELEKAYDKFAISGLSKPERVMKNRISSKARKVHKHLLEEYEKQLKRDLANGNINFDKIINTRQAFKDKFRIRKEHLFYSAQLEKQYDRVKKQYFNFAATVKNKVDNLEEAQDLLRKTVQLGHLERIRKHTAKVEKLYTSLMFSQSDSIPKKLFSAVFTNYAKELTTKINGNEFLLEITECKELIRKIKLSNSFEDVANNLVRMKERIHNINKLKKILKDKGGVLLQSEEIESFYNAATNIGLHQRTKLRLKQHIADTLDENSEIDYKIHEQLKGVGIYTQVLLLIKDMQSINEFMINVFQPLVTSFPDTERLKKHKAQIKNQIQLINNILENPLVNKELGNNFKEYLVILKKTKELIPSSNIFSIFSKKAKQSELNSQLMALKLTGKLLSFAKEGSTKSVTERMQGRRLAGIKNKMKEYANPVSTVPIPLKSVKPTKLKDISALPLDIEEEDIIMDLSEIRKDLEGLELDLSSNIENPEVSLKSSWDKEKTSSYSTQMSSLKEEFTVKTDLQPKSVLENQIEQIDIYINALKENGFNDSHKLMQLCVIARKSRDLEQINNTLYLAQLISLNESISGYVEGYINVDYLATDLSHLLKFKPNGALDNARSEISVITYLTLNKGRQGSDIGLVV